MADQDRQLAHSELAPPGDTEAIAYLRQSVLDGKHWYLALLGAIGLWTSAEEVWGDRTYRYLIDGEAFDWLLLAERLCETVDGLLPVEEVEALLFHGIPPLRLGAREVREFIGDRKYGQYLNYFYGVTVEDALLLVVQEEIDKEKRARGFHSGQESPDEAFLRIYGAGRDELLKVFRCEKRYSQLHSATLTEIKEFTYWLFKYRLKKCEKAKIASDTKKALEYLQRHWLEKGISRTLADDLIPHYHDSP
jgi:hypothetical protein